MGDKADGNYHNNGQNATNSEEYTGDTSTLTGMINSLIAQNTNQLEVVKTTSTADMAANADAQSAWDAAAAVEATEVAEFDRLVGVKNAKQAAYDAALQTQSTDGAIARALHKDDVDG